MMLSGTAATTVLVAPAGATRMTLTLSTGPMSGDVTLSALGRTQVVRMASSAEQQVTIDLPAGERLVPLTVQSSITSSSAESGDAGRKRK